MDHPPDKCSKSVEREHLFVPCDNYSTCQGCLQEHEWTPGFQQLYHWSNQAKACPHKVRLCPLDGVKMLFKCVGSLIIIFHHLSMADRGALFVKYWSVKGPSAPWPRIKVPFKRKRFGPRWSDAFDMFTCNQWAPVHWSPFNNWWAIIRYWRMHKKYLVYPPREGLQCDRPCWLRVKASILGEDYPAVVLGHSSVCGQVTPGPCTGTLHQPFSCPLKPSPVPEIKSSAASLPLREKWPPVPNAVLLQHDNQNEQLTDSDTSCTD